MAKSLGTLMVFPVAVFLLGGFFAVPAGAQGAEIKEKCVLSDNLDIEIPFKHNTYESIISIKKDSTISSTMKSDGISKGGADAKFKFKGPASATTNYEAVNDSNVLAALQNKWGLICLVNTINSTTSWIFLVLMSIAFVLILVAAFFWATSGGNSEKQKKAGQMIAAALIGIVIALLSRIIPGIVTGLLA
jgi:ATP-dependent Zn protease